MRKLGTTFEFYNRMNISIHSDRTGWRGQNKKGGNFSINSGSCSAEVQREGQDQTKAGTNKDPGPEKSEQAHGGFEINKGAACKWTLKWHKDGVTKYWALIKCGRHIHKMWRQWQTQKTLLSQWKRTDVGRWRVTQRSIQNAHCLPLFQENLVITLQPHLGQMILNLNREPEVSLAGKSYEISSKAFSCSVFQYYWMLTWSNILC